MKIDLKSIIILFFSLTLFAQDPTVSNKMFSFGSYGRAGIAYGIGTESEFPQSLNLNGMGSIGGRFEENDYLELAAAMHFAPKIENDTTRINVQTRLAFYTTQGQLIGNVSNKSIGGITTAMPELYAEANNIMGSNWSVWVGARLLRGQDIHIIDHFYFDDHSGQGAGIKYKNTQLSLIFTGSVDTTSTLPPNFYLNIVNGTPTLGLRNRYVSIIEHEVPIKKGYVKLLGEFHRLPAGNTGSDITTKYNYPADVGFVAGVKYLNVIKSNFPGSFNAVSARIGTGIANGGDGGASKTYLTYGGPNLETNSFRKAYSLALTETFLINFSKRYSLNAYAIYTKSRGASDSLNKTPDYLGKQMLFNRKQDISFGARGTYYIKNWLHLLHELDFAWRKDGTQDFAQMTKFTIAPTLVPTSIRDVWERPHFRLVYSVAYYNKFASENLYSPFLAQSGSQRWGQYLGIKMEWWIW